MRMRLIAVSLLLAACHSMRFELSKTAHENVVEHRGAFFLWGMFPEHERHGRSFCPAGVAAIEEETTLTDAVFTLLTLGIYSPRTSYFFCRPGAAE